jgi:glyoxylase-like metal-dependent hydrolase (beta-lactamase superfamily II)
MVRLPEQLPILEGHKMRKAQLSLFAVLYTVLLFVSVSTASAQKLYWTSSGLLGPFDIKGLIPSYPESRDIKLPVNMWILDHPKGLVLFDTGNNVAISDGQCKTHWAAGLCDFLKPSQTRADVIDKQLEKLGYKVDDVKIVITSHSHLDHIGNIEMFPKAIHVMQKKELYQAWWPEKFQRTGAHVMADYDDARDFNYLELNGDYDLFGDGSVIVLSTPGHTLGHQSIKVKLPETGTVILSQDAIWMEENLEGYPAGLNYSVLDYTNSVNRLKMMSDLENAKLWFGHSGKQYDAMGEKWYK